MRYIPIVSMLFLAGCGCSCAARGEIIQQPTTKNLTSFVQSIVFGTENDKCLAVVTFRDGSRTQVSFDGKLCETGSAWVTFQSVMQKAQEQAAAQEKQKQMMAAPGPVELADPKIVPGVIDGTTKKE